MDCIVHKKPLCSCWDCMEESKAGLIKALKYAIDTLKRNGLRVPELEEALKGGVYGRRK